MSVINAIKSNLEAAAQATASSGDYLSYAGVIDENLGDVEQFDTHTAAQALQVLADILDRPEYECLVYSIGWDIPELLMLYIDEFNSGLDGEPNQEMVAATGRLANILCIKSNPKEFFLKVCELMTGSESYDECDDDDIDINIDDVALEFHANTRFCVLFEMMRYSLNRIKTPYPSRFIKTANLILLDVANSKSSITGVTTVLRRIFIFARDFDMDFSEASQEEQATARRLLVSLLTYGTAVCLRDHSPKWTERFYSQLANNVQGNSDPNVRAASYNMSVPTARLEDAVSRCGQLALSYDMDPITKLAQYVNTEDTSVLHTYDKLPQDPEKMLDYLLTPSIGGMCFLYTQMHFDASPCVPNVEYSMRKASFLHRNCPTSAGHRDASLYWGLRLVTFCDASAFRDVPPAMVTEYIGVLMATAGQCPVVNERCIAFCIVGKLLAQLDQDVGVRVMLDAMRNIKYPQVLDAAVQILKSQLMGKKPSRCLLTRLTGLELCHREIDPALRKEVALMAEEAADDICAGQPPNPSILSWVNLLHVVPTDPPTVNRIKHKLTAYFDDHPMKNCELFKVALENLGTK